MSELKSLGRYAIKGCGLRELGMTFGLISRSPIYLAKKSHSPATDKLIHFLGTNRRYASRLSSSDSLDGYGQHLIAQDPGEDYPELLKD